MDQKKSKVIDMSQVLAPIISSRDTLAMVKKAVQEAETNLVNLDFNKVEFISRSAAHELLKIKEELRIDHKKEVFFANTNESVTDMIRVVAANRAVPKISQPEFTRKKEVSIESLSAF